MANRRITQAHFLLLTTLLIGVNGRAQLPITLPEEKPAISIALVAVQDKLKVGSPMILKVTVTNIINRTIGLSEGVRQGPYRVEVSDSEGKLPPETDFGYARNGHNKLDDVFKRFGIQALQDNSVSFTLKPAQTKVNELDVLRFYNLIKPGQYAIYVKRTALRIPLL